VKKGKIYIQLNLYLCQRGEDMTQKISRRKFNGLIGKLFGIGAVLPMSACQVEWEKGNPVARPTDGQLSEGVVEYFSDYHPVDEYDPELAELVNETYVKEFGHGIDKHINIEFLDNVVISGFPYAIGCYKENKDWEWRGLKYEKSKLIQVERGLSTFEAFSTVCHEIGHDEDPSERIPRLNEYRLGTMANVHFPDFGKKTACDSFYRVQLRMSDAGKVFRSGEKDRHSMGSLAAMFALNQNDGSFDAAHSALRSAGVSYAQMADNFVDYAKVQPEITVNYVLPDGRQGSFDLDYDDLALGDLRACVAYQVLQRNIAKNPSLDEKTKSALLDLTMVEAQPWSYLYNLPIRDPMIIYPEKFA
jgi:hypothetical protein